MRELADKGSDRCMDDTIVTIPESDSTAVRNKTIIIVSGTIFSQRGSVMLKGALKDLSVLIFFGACLTLRVK
ncbi:hypothetical protein EV356DRAFT_499936 [Viridothelium virens]|uniref:Uncharacterized protein n=1 Tax=Viridothelium virens TaxID=1048519 RepID=A0A6A6HQB6_VIRVR|nr:hypothetical protein EV356DRAFT_499936 [Viridothelium virens]